MLNDEIALAYDQYGLLLFVSLFQLDRCFNRLRRTHADLGRNWWLSLEIREGHTLITQGVFRYIRHPMYTS